MIIEILFVAIIVATNLGMPILIIRYSLMSGNSNGLNLLRLAILGLIFSPSLFLSSHFVIPVPAIIALGLGLAYPSPAMPGLGAVGIYMVSNSITIGGIYMYHYLIISRRKNT